MMDMIGDRDKDLRTFMIINYRKFRLILVGIVLDSWLPLINAVRLTTWCVRATLCAGSLKIEFSNLKG